MAITHYLTATPIEPLAYSAAGSGVPTIAYYGTARTHPYDTRKIILVPYPYHPGEGVYEFHRDDILYAENTSEVANEDGDILTVMWVHVRKGAHAVNLKSFTVGS